MIEELRSKEPLLKEDDMAIQRTTDTRWRRPSASFGERTLVKLASARPTLRTGLRPIMVLAMYDGHQDRAGAFLALTVPGSSESRKLQVALR